MERFGGTRNGVRSSGEKPSDIRVKASRASPCLGSVTLLALTLCRNLVRGGRTGFNNSGVEEYPRDSVTKKTNTQLKRFVLLRSATALYLKTRRIRFFLGCLSRRSLG